MKSWLPYFRILLAFTVFQSCTNNVVESVKKVEPSKEDILANLHQNLFQVITAYRIEGNDTINMLTDGNYEFRKTTYLVFKNNFVYFCTGFSSPNTMFPASAKTFAVGRKIELPVNLQYEWDENRGTIKVSSYGQSSFFKMIKEGQKGYLETDNLILYKTRDEAQAGVQPENMTFTYVDQASPKDITYKISVKPMWSFIKEPRDITFYDYVMF